MNRVWAMKAEERLTQLEARTKAQPENMPGLLADALARLEARVAALENKPKPGRPPKEKTE